MPANTQPFVSVEYRVKVSGIIWDGGSAFTHYTFNQHPTRTEVLERSGDFRQVKKIEVTKLERISSRISLMEVSNAS